MYNNLTMLQRINNYLKAVDDLNKGKTNRRESRKGTIQGAVVAPPGAQTSPRRSSSKLSITRLVPSLNRSSGEYSDSSTARRLFRRSSSAQKLGKSVTRGSSIATTNPIFNTESTTPAREKVTVETCDGQALVLDRESVFGEEPDRVYHLQVRDQTSAGTVENVSRTKHSESDHWLRGASEFVNNSSTTFETTSDDGSDVSIESNGKESDSSTSSKTSTLSSSSSSSVDRTRVELHRVFGAANVDSTGRVRTGSFSPELLESVQPVLARIKEEIEEEQRGNRTRGRNTTVQQKVLSSVDSAASLKDLGLTSVELDQIILVTDSGAEESDDDEGVVAPENLCAQQVNNHEIDESSRRDDLSDHGEPATKGIQLHMTSQHITHPILPPSEMIRTPKLVRELPSTDPVPIMYNIPPPPPRPHQIDNATDESDQLVLHIQPDKLHEVDQDNVEEATLSENDDESDADSVVEVASTADEESEVPGLDDIVDSTNFAMMKSESAEEEELGATVWKMKRINDDNEAPVVMFTEIEDSEDGQSDVERVLEEYSDASEDDTSDEELEKAASTATEEEESESEIEEKLNDMIDSKLHVAELDSSIKDNVVSTETEHHADLDHSANETTTDDEDDEETDDDWQTEWDEWWEWYGDACDLFQGGDHENWANRVDVPPHICEVTALSQENNNWMPRTSEIDRFDAFFRDLEESEDELEAQNETGDQTESSRTVRFRSHHSYVEPKFSHEDQFGYVASDEESDDESAQEEDEDVIMARYRMELEADWDNQSDYGEEEQNPQRTSLRRSMLPSISSFMRRAASTLGSVAEHLAIPAPIPVRGTVTPAREIPLESVDRLEATDNRVANNRTSRIGTNSTSGSSSSLNRDGVDNSEGESDIESDGRASESDLSYYSLNDDVETDEESSVTGLYDDED